MKLAVFNPPENKLLKDQFLVLDFFFKPLHTLHVAIIKYLMICSSVAHDTFFTADTQLCFIPSDNL